MTNDTIKMMYAVMESVERVLVSNIDTLCQHKDVVPWPSGDIEGQCDLAQGHGGHHELVPNKDP